MIKRDRRKLASAAAVLLLTVVLAVGAQAQFVPDDFNACDIGSPWVFTDPANDGATATIVGGYTDDARLAISVPNGATHEIWNTVIGAPHLSQPMSDTDLVAEVKFDSNLPQNYGQEGILIQQSNTQWLRLEFYRTETGQSRIAAIGGPTTVFHDEALGVGAQAPLYMRVERTGDTWTQSWSDDGVVWNVAGSPFSYAFAPAEIGVYAGNRGSNPPAHTVWVDYFTNTAGAPVDEDVERNTLTVNVVGGGLVQHSPDLPEYACGDAVTLTAVDQPGWAFAGWTGDAAGSQNPVIVTMDGPVNVTATFTAVAQHAVNVTLVGGGTVTLDPPGGLYNEGTVVTVTAEDTAGWEFDSWSGDLTGSINPTSLTVDAPKSVTATFNAVAQHTLTALVQPGGAGSVTLDPPGGVYNVGTPVIVTATADPGWGFANWLGDLTGSANPDTVIMDADKSVTAVFQTLPEHVLTINTVGNGAVTVSPDQPTYLAGTPVEITAVPDPGWMFTGWSGDHTGSANPDTVIMDVDRTVTATFTEIPPVIEADDFSVCDLDPVWTVVDPFGDGGTATVVDAYTDSARVAISVPGGFPHEIWDGVIGATHILQPAQDIDFTIEAKFDADMPTNFGQEGILIKQDETTWVRAEFFRDDFGLMRVAVDRGPNLTTHDVYLPAGTTAPLWMRLTREGDTFTQLWSLDGVSWNVAGAPFDYPMTVTGVGLFAGNRGVQPPAHTVLVDWINHSAGAPAAEDSLRAPLDVAVVGGGLVTRDLDLANYGCGQVETLTAVDQPGWVFTGWTGDVTSTDNPLLLAMDGPASVTANFAASPTHTLTVLTVGNGAVTLDPPGGVYNVGTSVALTATPDPDWLFGGWSGDLAGTANPDTIVVDADRTVTATFNELVYAFQPDDFNACELDSMWTFVDPLGDGGAAVVTGAYSDDARLAISTPGDQAHELWNGVISAPHVLQAAQDVDFVAEVKFDSSLPSEFFGQEGIIVKQDEANWLRLEFFSGGAYTYVFAALPDGSTTPVYEQIGGNTPYLMRVTRTGDVWDLQWSTDGVQWNTPAGSGFTYAMTVNEIGLYAGNTGLNPAHTVLVDYFNNSPLGYVDEDALRAPLSVATVGNGTVLVSPDKPSYDCGELVTVTAVGDVGWGFTGWSGDLAGQDNPATIVMSGPASIQADFATLASYNITTNVVGGGGSVVLDPPTGPYYDGSLVVVTAVDGPGWGFDAWSGDLAGAANPDTLLVDGDKNITATFVAVPQFTVAASVPGGNGTIALDPAGGTYNQGTSVVLTAVGDPGWGLDAWAGDLTGSANPDTLVVDANKTVTASFAPLPQYNLTVNVSGSGTVIENPLGGIHYVGTEVELTAVPDPGWRFDGWTGDLTGSANPDTILVDADRTVTALFSELPPVFLADDFNRCELGPDWTFVDLLDDGSSVQIVHAYSDSARAAISVVSGAEHEIWDGVVAAPHLLQPSLDQDFVCEVKFDGTPPTDYGQQGLLVSQDNATWIRAEVYRNTLGELHAAVVLGPRQPLHDVLVPEPVNAGIRLRIERVGDDFTLSWSHDGAVWSVVGATFNYPMIVGGIGPYAGNRGGTAPAHTVLVDYFANSAGAPAGEDVERNRIDLTVTGGGVVDRDLDTVDYDCGDVETLTAVDQPGWVFTGWTGDYTGTDNPLVLPMDGAVTLTANFLSVPEYDLTAVVAAGNGSIQISPPGGTYNEGTVVVLTATPDLGWGLDAWSGDLTGAASPDTLVMDGDKTVQATFVALAEYTLTLGTIGNGTVTADPDQATYYDGTAVALTATPDPGWLFGGWSGGLTGQAVADTVIVDADKTVTATFLEIIPVAASDDFNACALDSIWTVVDPFSDGGTAQLVNAFTDSAAVAISVPGGSEHEIWNGVIGATHILQPAVDTDFTLEAKFDSRLPADFAQEGILVKQDETTWVRAEFFRDEFDNLRVAVDRGPAQITHDVYLPSTVQAPLWMRLTRSGDTFTQYWSEDGVNWNMAGTPFPYSMTVTGIGLFAGNRGFVPPAHTVLVDYLTTTEGAPAGEDLERNTLAVQTVGGGTVGLALGGPEYSCGDIETLTAVPDSGWVFAGWSGDLTGADNPALLPVQGDLQVTASFQQLVAPNHIDVVPAPGACLSTAVTCLDDVPVRLLREDVTGVRSFSLTVTLTDLVLCGGVGGITEGTYLSAIGTTDFQVTDNLDGSYLVTGTIVGEPCGVTAADGVLFHLDLAAGVADGNGTVAISGVELRDCADAPLSVQASAPASIVIDTTLPDAATNLAASQVLTGNSSDGTTAIDVNWTAPTAPDVSSIIVYRKGFGGHPEYSDAGGTVPAVPADPGAEGWQLAAVLPPATAALRDLAAQRDYWYYYVVTTDLCGNSTGSTIVAGGLNYLLADVAGGTVDGDNAVDANDIAALTAGYGTSDGQPGYAASLDVGPTLDRGLFSLPETDNVIDFEDMMVFGLSHGLDAGPGGGSGPGASASPPPAARNFLMLDVPALPAVGQTFDVTVLAEGDGTIHGLSLPLSWNPVVAQPLSVQSGQLLDDQDGGNLLLMPQPGVVDLALLGQRTVGLSGTGTLLTVTFEVLAGGPHGMSLGTVTARDGANMDVLVQDGGLSPVIDVPQLPSVAALHQNAPNPFNPQTTLAFDVTRPGRVQLHIYGLDGRHVRTLVDENVAAGRHAYKWDGTDGRGRQVASGVYLYRLATGEGVFTRRMLLLK